MAIATAMFLAAHTLAAQGLAEFNQDRLDLAQKGMLVLGTWAAGNLLSGPIMANQRSGSDKYFFQMNAYWNVVNLALAGFGFYAAKTADPASFGLAASLAEQHKIEKLLLFNAGLDIGYVLGGLYLRERARRSSENGDQLKGFGQSIILQGAWLFAFDVGFYLVQQGHGKRIFGLVEALSLHPNGFMLGIRL